MSNFDQPFQNYEILDRVGGGAMGTVFKARHKRLNRIVALKILKPSLARDKRYVERLRREARIVASLSHPHIVTGYDLGEESGYHFFVMEFVEGKSLRQLLVEWGIFSEEYVLRVAREAALALDHAYQRDVIHRDIKPGNILIDESGNVKLADMGLAKGPADLALTRDGATVGTPMYISPEQARNPQDVDVRGDLYSLGATLYHMATGVPPFSGDTMAELITRVLNDTVVPPDEVNSAVSSGTALVIRKLLAKNLTVRYQTPRELLDDLDRIEQSQLPAVDAGHLDVDAIESSRWLRMVLVAMVAMLLGCGAWWLGRQMVDPVAPVSSPEEYLQQLDTELRGLPSPGARHLKLSTIVERPAGTVRPFEQRRRQVAIELQQVVDDVVTELDGPLRSRIDAWLHDPVLWPDLAQFERKYVDPLVRQRAGIGLEQMPSRVSSKSLEDLLLSVARVIRERDAGLMVRFQQFLTTELPGRANERLRASDFAAADALWRDALLTFCDGVQHPLPERLPEKTRDRIESERDQARVVAQADLDAVEQATIRALNAEVATTVADFTERLKGGADAKVVGEALQRFRSNLGHYWPSANSFRLSHDPWPGVEQQLMSAEHAVELAMSEGNAQRFDARCDLAWRVYCGGDAAAALSVLDHMEPVTEAQKQELVGYRRCLVASQQVEQALFEAIAGQVEPLVAFRLGATVPYALRVESSGESLQLFGSAVGQGKLALRLTELRIGDLLGRLGAEETGPLREMATVPRALGLAVLRLVAGDALGLDRHVSGLHGADRTLLLEHVWPRIDRVRDAGVVLDIDLDSLFATLEEAMGRLDAGGELLELESALFAVKSLSAEQCTPRQLRLRRSAQQRRKLCLRERGLRIDLQGRAPRDAIIDVEVENDELVGVVTLPASVLYDDAGDGWEMRGDALEFAGGGRVWSEQPNLTLHGKPGYEASSRKARLELELAFPNRDVDRRSYLIEFDGIAVMLVIAANDSVQVELVDGDARDAGRVNRAFERALSGAFAPPRALVIPGGLHRLSIDVAMTAPTQANVVVTLEGKVLLRQLHSCATKRVPDFALHPLQEVTVSRATVRVAGL